VNDFVDQCRHEWARLGVPDAVANEMAADLSADLEEAERDGMAAEEVLGSGAFDAAAFAHSWAAERGVIPTPPPSMPSAPHAQRRWAPFAIAGAVALGLVGALLAIVATSRLAFGRAARAVGPAPLQLPGRRPVIPPDVVRRFALPDHIALHAGVGPWALALLVLMVAATVAGAALGAALWSRRPRARA
jgi:hypothetical protein